MVATGFLPARAGAAPGLSGIAAEEGARETVGSGISPSRDISLIHSLGVSAELRSPAARAGPPAAANATWIALRARGLA